MKLLFALAFLLAITSCFASPQTFSFTGATKAGQWGGITLSSSGCSLSRVLNQNYTYFSFSIDSSNSSYYFVIGSLLHTDLETLNVYVYNNTLDFSNPCNGIYTQLLNHVESDLEVFDGIYLAEGNYTVLVSSQASLIWGLNFSPSTTVLNITSSSNPYLAPYYDDVLSNSNNCAVNTASTHYESFSWVQQTSGYFDIYGIAINNTQINPFTKEEFSVWLSLFNGTIGNLTANACQGNFIAGGSSFKSVGALDYVWLSQGGTYTVVASINSIFGQVGLQITPSTLYSLSNTTLFTYPQDITNCEEDNKSSTDPSGETPWFSKIITSSSPIGIFTATRPFYQDYYSFFYPQLYLYYGQSTGKPPEECYNLVDISYEYDIVGYVSSFNNGATSLTVVVGDPDGTGSLTPTSSVFHLYVFSGTDIFTPPGLNPIITTTSSSSSTTRTTSGSQTSTTTTGLVHQATTSSSSSSITTTSSSSSSSAKSSSTTGVVSSATATGHQNQGASTTTSTSTTGINEVRGTTSSTSGSEQSSTTGGINAITSTGAHEVRGTTSSTSGSGQTKTSTGSVIKTTTGTAGVRGNHTTTGTGENDFFSEGSVTSISMVTLVLLSSLLLLV